MYRILLVDDEALIREEVSENVPWEQYGYELAGSCENGQEALEFIEKTPVDVVLTDICMPWLDGMQLAERLSESWPDIRIILLSGYDEFEYAKNAIRFGVKEYLLKPITACELGEVLTGLKKEMDKEREDRKKLSRMKASFHKGQLLLYSDALRNLIMGNKSEEESRRELEEAGIRLEAAVYCVAVAELDIYTRTVELDEKQKKESALMAFVLYNISQEIVGEAGCGEVCQGTDLRSYILFHSDRRSDLKRRIEDACENIIAQVNRIIQLAVNIGVGEPVYAMKDIFRSFEMAERALSWHYVLGANRVISSASIHMEKREADVENVLEKMILHVRENNVTGLGEDFRRLEEILQEAMYDRRSAETVLQRVATAMEELLKLCGGRDENAPSGRTASEEVLAAGGLEEAVEKLCAFCEETAERLARGKSKSGKRYAAQALDYIEKNYADCNLSLHSVCSYLNISASRFSCIFKEATGTTFMDVLSGIRMKKAKELLENTDLKNYEIAERVGYNDPHYFSIAFKKAAGKSPSEYAKEMRR